MVTIGQMRDRVTVQTRTKAVNDYGEPVPTWEDLATVWAQVEQISGAKTLGEAPELTSRVTLRAISGLTPACRLVIDGVVHQIQSVVVDPTGRFVEVLCQSKEAQ